MPRKGTLALLLSCLLFGTACRRHEATPTRVGGQAFHFMVPGDWHVDTSEKNYDPEYAVTVHGPTGCVLIVYRQDELLDEQTSLSAHLTAQRKATFKSASETPHGRYAHYDAHGARLDGPVKPIGTGSYRVSAFHAGDSLYTVAEFSMKQSAARCAPAFAMVERTFDVAKASRDASVRDSEMPTSSSSPIPEL